MALRNIHGPLIENAAWLAASLAWKGILFWLLAAILWVRGYRLLAVQIVVALLIAIVEASILKGSIGRPRPDLYLSLKLNIPMPELLTSEHSFPSGHVTLAAAAAAVLTMTLRDWRGWLAIALVAAVGVARVYQGFHWPTDIIGSIVLGFIAAVVALKVCQLPISQRICAGKSAAPAESNDAEVREKTAV